MTFLIILLLPLALLASATAFPAMLFESFLPMLPPSEKVMIGVTWNPGTWYHWLKNLTTEMFRAHEQWWSKFTMFVILIQSVLLYWRW